MSYDLAVFDPTSAPSGRDEFLAWFDKQAEWAAPRDYNSLDGTSPALRDWYQLMIPQFPAMNGPDRSDAWNSRVSDYCIGSDVIYVAFASSVAKEAYTAVRRAAEQAGVGFLDASGDGEVWRPI
ncbi:hypothetical protein [Sphingomonas aerophila]|uniref:Uncharacterized protein n=1 Tax=Sphingomonas aerophila TaxID=1344948 RepID=A0A7W9BGX3_9SPHN|nr:hypothetical protein [Sphingomonas aerophila]MBB5716928.1 hypothetical protein [Sphingomonas aerophila]